MLLLKEQFKSLKNNGKMAYLIPSNIFKNVFANDLREFLKPHIIKIYDYTIMLMLLWNIQKIENMYILKTKEELKNK